MTAPSRLAERLDAAIKAAGVAITGVSIGRYGERATWRVSPAHLQGAAQPTIDAFNPDDPAHAAADLTAMALADSRRKDVLATLAVIVKDRDLAAWNAMTTNQKVQAVRDEANIWKSFREFIDDKAV